MGNVGVGELLLIGTIALLPILAFAAILIAVVVSGRNKARQGLVLRCPSCGGPLSSPSSRCQACSRRP